MAGGAPAHGRIAGHALRVFKKQGIAAMTGKHFHGDLFPVNRARENPDECQESASSGCSNDHPHESENRNTGLGGK